ncbi:MAG: HAD family hydrolase [Clostridia bacterium]|nr:HAD family hydrolase [Clostridia bacterium]
MDFTYCIWDFNGTILDDVETGIRSVNTMLAKRNLPVIPSRAAYRELFRFPVMEYYRSLGFDFEREPYEDLAIEWVDLYLHHVREATLCPDVTETLAFFQKAGIRQVILSATEKSMLRQQLSSLSLLPYFHEIMGRDDIHAGSKLDLAAAWRKRNPRVKAVFVGDTDHDVEAARAMGADCVLISCGHQSEAYLQTLGVPVYASLGEWRKTLQ